MIAAPHNSHRMFTSRLRDRVQRHLVALPAIRLPLPPGGTDCDLDSIGLGGYRLTVHRRMCGAVVVVTVDGAVDGDGARELGGRLQEILAQGNLSRLVVDLGRVSFLSDSGVRTLIRAGDAGSAGGIGVAVVTGDGAAGAVLDMRDLRSRIPTAPDVDSACAEVFHPGGEARVSDG